MWRSETGRNLWIQRSRKATSVAAAALATLQLQPRPCIFLVIERALNFFLSIKSSAIIYFLLLFNSCWLLNATSGSGNPETADCWKQGGYWWGSGKGITLCAPCYYIIFLSICLCLLSKAGYWAGWIFHLTLDGSSHVFGECSGCEPPSSRIWGSQTWLSPPA